MPLGPFIRLLKKAKPKFHLFLLNIALAPLIAAFELISFGLLVPILQIMISQPSQEKPLNVPAISFLKNLAPAIFLPQNIVWVILLIAAATSAKLAVQYVSGVLTARESRRIEMNLRIHLFDHALNLGPLFFDCEPIGSTRLSLLGLPSCLTRGLEIIESSLTHIWIGASYLAVLFLLSRKLMILTLLFLCAVFLVIKHFRKKILELSRKILENSIEKESFVLDRLANLKLVKSFGEEDREIRRFKEMESQNTRALIQYETWSGLAAPIQEWLGTVAIALLMIFGFYFLSKQTTPQMIPLILSVLLWKRASSLLVSLNTSSLQWLALQPGILELSKFLDLSQKPVIENGSKKFEGLTSHIEFRGVSMSYDGQKEILKDISLEVQKGDVLAVIGPSGAGKTTFVELVPRFYEFQKGRILLDGTDIKEFDLRSLRQKIGLISQETLCFNDTVFNNITYAKEGAAPGEVVEAAKKAEIHDTILSFEKKYNTLMGDKGAKLSGGELQRIALARMFLKNPDILILDEPLNSLDAGSQLSLRDNLKKLMLGRTVFWISHEPSFIDFADKVIHIQDGRITKTEEMVCIK